MNITCHPSRQSINVELPWQQTVYRPAHTTRSMRWLMVSISAAIKRCSAGIELRLYYLMMLLAASALGYVGQCFALA